MLTADAGTMLRESGVPAERRLEVWAGMLRAFAALQRAVAPRAGELVALGVPDLRPLLVPGRLTSLLAAGHVLELKPGAPELAGLRDAYLEPWATSARRPNCAARPRLPAASPACPAHWPGSGPCATRPCPWTRTFAPPSRSGLPSCPNPT
jgi:hypothetical protein